MIGVIVSCVSPGNVFPAHISLRMHVSPHIAILLGMYVSQRTAISLGIKGMHVFHQ